MPILPSVPAASSLEEMVSAFVVCRKKDSTAPCVRRPSSSDTSRARVPTSFVVSTWLYCICSCRVPVLITASAFSGQVRSSHSSKITQVMKLLVSAIINADRLLDWSTHSWHVCSAPSSNRLDFHGVESSLINALGSQHYLLAE